jgi:phage/plasmid-associated DNA primase
LPEEGVVDYLLDCMAYSLCGIKYDEFFISMVGDEGRNGKGLINMFIKKIFGDYFGSIDIRYFTTKTSAGSACD